MDGDVEMAANGPVEKITDPVAILTKGAEMEAQSAAAYNAAALEMDHIHRFGPNYLALQSFAAPAKPETDLSGLPCGDVYLFFLGGERTSLRLGL